MPSHTSPYLSVGKVARMCGVSNRTVLNWIDQGRLNAHALPSGHYRVHVDEIRQFMSAHKMEAPTRLTEADAIQASLCWRRRDLTGSHDCASCAVFATQAWHCFVLRTLMDDGQTGCDVTCSECSFYREVYRPIGESLELDGHPCAVSRGGVLLAVNSSFVSLLHQPAASLPGARWLDLAKADDLTPLQARSVEIGAADATSITHIPGFLLRRTGLEVPVTFLVAPFPSVYGAVLCRIEQR